MCVLAFAWRAHPRWRLVLIGNRDERHDRPALPLARWPEQPDTLGGIDLVSGGSWLAASERGRLVVVTNIRGAGFDPHAPSRGRLVADLATGAGAYAGATPEDLGHFNPLNLIVVDRDQAGFLSNRPHPHQQLLAPGLYGMSNGSFDDGWPKTDRLKASLAHWLAEDARDPMALLAALADEHRPRADQLPNTGLPPDRERVASSIFIRNESYGTRCSSVVAVDANGRGLFLERSFDAQGRVVGDVALDFSWLA